MKAALTLTLLLIGSTSFADYSYVGLGFTIQKENKKALVQVVELVENGPAERAAIQVGEYITHVDGTSVIGRKLAEVSKLLRGEVGTFLTLTIQTSVDGPSRDVRLQREIIRLECFLEGYMNLRYSGPENFGNITGYIGNDRVYLNVSGSRATGYIKNERVSLWFDDRQIGNGPSRGDYILSGYIKNTYVNWRAFGGSFNQYVSCIR